MVIAVVDGMGGGIGAQIVTSLYRYLCFRYKFNCN